MATGDFGPGRMPPDMFLNCNEEIKRQSPTNNQEPEHANYLDQGRRRGWRQGQGAGAEAGMAAGTGGSSWAGGGRQGQGVAPS